MLDADPLLRRLTDAGVGYVIVGGFAVIAHGVVRAAGRPRDLQDLADLEIANG